MFCWTEVGAQCVGIFQSLISTCRLQGVDPYTYLVDVLQRVEDHPARQIVTDLGGDLGADAFLGLEGGGTEVRCRHDARMLDEPQVLRGLALEDVQGGACQALPLDRLRELVAEGEVGSLAETHYSIMGFQGSDSSQLENESAPAIAEIMKSEEVDLALLAPV